MTSTSEPLHCNYLSDLQTINLADPCITTTYYFLSMYHPPSRSLGKHVHRQLLCSAASTTSTTPKIRQNASRLPTVRFVLLQKVQQLQRPAPEKSTIPLLCKPSSQLLLHLNFCPQLINSVQHHIVKMQHRSLIASRIWQNFTATWAAWHVDYLVSQKWFSCHAHVDFTCQVQPHGREGHTNLLLSTHRHDVWEVCTA